MLQSGALEIEVLLHGAITSNPGIQHFEIWTGALDDRCEEIFFAYLYTFGERIAKYENSPLLGFSV